MLPFGYYGFCFLNSLHNFSPVSFQQSRSVRFLPSKFMGHWNLAIPRSFRAKVAMQKSCDFCEPKTGQFYLEALHLPLAESRSAHLSSMGEKRRVDSCYSCDFRFLTASNLAITSSRLYSPVSEISCLSTET